VAAAAGVGVGGKGHRSRIGAREARFAGFLTLT
jgi:hypothetical protein